MEIYKTIDLFAGIGGLRLGFEQTGRCDNVFSAEIDKKACQTYESNFGNNPYCDVTTICASDLPDFDILLAGFPCQAFSSMGLRKGFKESRGQLFFDIARILEAKRPSGFLLENVKGLLNHDRGNTFKTILNILTEELDYKVSYQILNSKDFGAPQNRERVYIVGFKDESDFKFPAKSNIACNVEMILETNVDEKYWLSQKYLDGLRKHKEAQKEKGNGFGYKILDPKGIANTAIACSYGREGNLIIDSSVISKNDACARRFTPREYARLQTFPDDFKIHPINTQAYKQIGNSVTISVINAIAKEMLIALDSRF